MTVSILAPEIILSLAGIVVLLLSTISSKIKNLLFFISTTAAGAALYFLPFPTRTAGHLEISHTTKFFSILTIIALIITLLGSIEYTSKINSPPGEYIAILLWATVGILLFLKARDFILLFVALELFSICLYILVGYNTDSPLSIEGALKYFLMGAFASAFLSLGIAFIYGETSFTRFQQISHALARNGNMNAELIYIATVLILSVLFFKLAAAPFHSWSPDTYQGGVTPFIAFLSTAPKAAVLLVLIKFLPVILSLPNVTEYYRRIIELVAILSIVIGNVLAFQQLDIKRMLAYSGIAHVGYMLIPLVTLDLKSYAAPVAVYSLAYIIMNSAAFILVDYIFQNDNKPHLIEELAGIGYKYPLAAFSLTVLLISLTGLPPTLGFIGKYFVFLYALANGLLHLAIIGIVFSLVGAGYYLRVIYFLYMKQDDHQLSQKGNPFSLLVSSICALFVIVLGIYPSLVTDWIVMNIR